MFAGAAVAAATLGTLGASHAKADIIPSFTVNLTSENTTPVTCDGMTLPAHTSAQLIIQNFNTAAGADTGTGYEVITTSTGLLTTPVEPIGSGWSNGGGYTILSIGGNASPYEMGFNFQALTSSVTAYCPTFPGVGTAVGDANLFSYITAKGPFYTPSTQYGYTSNNSPDFAIDSMTLGAPEPSSLALGLAGAVGLLASRPRRKEDLAMAGL
jgi:hypothetical protein